MYFTLHLGARIVKVFWSLEAYVDFMQKAINHGFTVRARLQESQDVVTNTLYFIWNKQIIGSISW